jgi:uncharacterized protein YndB with AHSA1/START domain
MPSTIRLHRVLRAPPERVFRAFLDPAAKAKWLPPNGFTCTVHHDDARVNGTFRMSFTNFANGQSHAFGGRYVTVEADRQLSYTDVFDDPNLPGEMTTTIKLTEVSCGTDLQIEQAGVPDVIPPEMCYLGWQDSLRQLAALVEMVPEG